MPSVGVLILFAAVGAVMCARARVAGGAVVFALIGLSMFVSTPVGSGLPGAMSSFFSFSFGAIIPLLTFFAGVSALWPALAVSGMTLYVAGAVVAKLTNKPMWFGGLRQLGLATLAAGVTYLVGRAIGASVT